MVNIDSKEFQEFVNYDFCSFADWLFSLNAYEFAFISSLIGFLIAPTLTINQQNSLGNFFELLGQVLLTINAQNTTLKQKAVLRPGIKHGLEEQNLINEIIKLKAEVIQLRSDIFNNNKM